MILFKLQIDVSNVSKSNISSTRIPAVVDIAIVHPLQFETNIDDLINDEEDKEVIVYVETKESDAANDDNLKQEDTASFNFNRLHVIKTFFCLRKMDWKIIVL